MHQVFDMTAYLKRIHYDGGTAVSVETLKNLHIAHTMNVPFENLDVFEKKPISLKIDDLFKKIVIDRRGGYCFEMNGLFSFVLKNLGFSVKNLLARVWVNNSEYGGKTHQVLVAEIGNQQWLCDVGFGGNGLVAPLLLAEGVEQEQYGRSYRIAMNPAYGYVLQYRIKGEFQPVYAFSLEACYPNDYEIANYYTSTHPSSRFIKERIFTKPTETGRVTLLENRLKIITGDQETVKILVNDMELSLALWKYFGIYLVD